MINTPVIKTARDQSWSSFLIPKDLNFCELFADFEFEDVFSFLLEGRLEVVEFLSETEDFVALVLCFNSETITTERNRTIAKLLSVFHQSSIDNFEYLTCDETTYH